MVITAICYGILGMDLHIPEQIPRNILIIRREHTLLQQAAIMGTKIYVLPNLNRLIEAISNHTDLLVYPNPAQNNLFIHTQNLVEDGEILIYSISGEKVKAVSLANNQTLNISLSISELTQGLYFIVFKTGIYCYPGQFIKTI